MSSRFWPMKDSQAITEVLQRTATCIVDFSEKKTASITDTVSPPQLAVQMAWVCVRVTRRRVRVLANQIFRYGPVARAKSCWGGGRRGLKRAAGSDRVVGG